MAWFQVLYWKDIPSQVKAWDDENGVAKQLLAKRFQVAIDARAMHEQETNADAYLDAWAWGPTEERSGTPEEVARLVALELDEGFPASRLRGVS